MIYMDYNATTPCDERVVQAMLPYFTEHFGNAASRSHALGWKAESAVEEARATIAEAIGAEAKEIVFTSGATEAVNLAIKGVFRKYHTKGKHIITMTTEHKAVLDTCADIERMGGEITYLGVDEKGLIDLDELRNAIRKDTILVSVMWANNETGVIQAMDDIGKICQEKGVLLMSDATQALGKIPLNVKKAGVHLAAFSAHKLYGPKGIGVLYISHRKPRVQIAAQLHGGGHENGMRSGTLNVPGIVGFGEAVKLACAEMDREDARLRRMRDRFEEELAAQVEAVFINGKPDQRLPHVSNMSFKCLDGQDLMLHLKRSLCISSGSACTSATMQPSHVLQAYGMGKGLARGGLRFSLGRMSSEREIEEGLGLVVKSIQTLRSRNPVWEMYKKGIDIDSLGM